MAIYKNSAGVTVDEAKVGTKSAADWAAQGFSIVTSSANNSAVVNTNPTGQVAINGAKYNTRELQQANFSNIQPVGNTLYGTPKAQTPTITSNVIPASALVQNNTAKLNETISKATTNLQDHNYWQTQYDNAEKNINSMMQPYYDQLKTANTDYGNIITNELNPKQNEITNLNSSYKQGMNNIEDRTIPMTDIVGKQASVERRYNEQLSTLTAQESNIMTKLGLKQNQMEQLRSDANFQLQVQNQINAQKQDILTQANRLQDKQQELMVGYVNSLIEQGIDIDTLPASVTAKVAQSFESAGVPWDLVVATADAVKTQKALDTIKEQSASSLAMRQSGYVYLPDQASLAKAVQQYGEQAIYTDSATKKKYLDTALAVDQTAVKSSGKASGGGGNGGGGDYNSNGQVSSLTQSIIDNPSLFDDLTPTKRGAVIEELQSNGYDTTNLGVKGLDSTAIATITQSEKALSELKNLQTIVANNQEYIGPISGWQKLNPWSKARQVQSDIDRVKQSVGKALEGGVLRKEDEEKYKKILATLNDTPETAMYKITSIITAVQNEVNTYKSLQSSSGRSGDVTASLKKKNTNSTNSSSRPSLDSFEK